MSQATAPSDASSYRSKEEIDAWEGQDSIIAFGKELVEAGIADQNALNAIWDKVKEDMVRNLKLSIDDSVSPISRWRPPTRTISPSSCSPTAPSAPLTRAESPRCCCPVRNAPGFSRSPKGALGLDKDGKPVSKNRVYQLRDGIAEPIINKFYEDPTLITFGEDVRDWGGAFAVYRGMTEALPYHRLFNSPIAEAGIVGAAVGYAMAGGRVVAELMYCDFLGRAGDEVFNQLSKWQAMSAGMLKMPVVLRLSVGSKYGAQHSQDWSALVAHIPGLKVYFPSTPTDAKGMLNLALAGTDPVVFLESQLLYDIGEQFEADGVPEGYYETPEGEPAIRREGSDVTILSIGATLYRVLPAADMLKENTV